MLTIKKHGVILAPTKLDFESRAVLNPAIYQHHNCVQLIYRAIDRRNVSTLGYAKLNGPLTITERWNRPLLKPSYKYESQGMEDPRLTKIGRIFYLTYVAHDGKNAQIAYASGNNLLKLTKGGLISPRVKYALAGHYFRQNKLKDDYYFFEAYYKNYGGKDVLIWEKDGLLFPEKIKGKFVLTHRILPDIQIVYFKNFVELKDKKFWINYLRDFDHHVILEGKHGWEERHIGGGAPPVKTKYGWLLIYHGAEESNKGRVYRAGAALFDLANPSRLVSRLPYPLFEPDEEYELTGQVNNVVFPTGTAVFDDRLYIYYGAADSHIAVASVKLRNLLLELRRYKE